MMAWTVYGLYDALGDLRYVGQTAGPLWKRLADHIAHARETDSRPVLRWLWSVYSAGGSVTIAPLKTDAKKGTDEKAIIKAMALQGFALLNVEHCGDAKSDLMKSVLLSPAARKRKSEAAKASMTPERRSAISAMFKGKPKSPEHKAKIAQATRGRLANAERNADGTLC